MRCNNIQQVNPAYTGGNTTHLACDKGEHETGAHLAHFDGLLWLWTEDHLAWPKLANRGAKRN